MHAFEIKESVAQDIGYVHHGRYVTIKCVFSASQGCTHPIEQGSYQTSLEW